MNETKIYYYYPPVELKSFFNIFIFFSNIGCDWQLHICRTGWHSFSTACWGFWFGIRELPPWGVTQSVACLQWERLWEQWEAMGGVVTFSVTSWSDIHNGPRQLLPGCDKPTTRYDLITITDLEYLLPWIKYRLENSLKKKFKKHKKFYSEDNFSVEEQEEDVSGNYIFNKTPIKLASFLTSSYFFQI